MTIYWSLLAPGLLLLLFPADRLLSSLVELRTFESFQSLENSPRYRPWWWVPALWIDPVRSLGGTLLLQHGLSISTIEPDLASRPAYWLAVGVLGLAVLCQTFTRRGEDALLAPIGFVAGIVAALTPLTVTAVGLVIALTGLFAFRRFHAFFSVGLIAITVLGFLFKVSIVWLVPAIAVHALPLIAGVVTGNTLELPTRDPSGRPSQPA